MSVPVASIPEFEEVVARGSPERRAKTLKRITAFFIDRASCFNEDHLRLFDDLFGRLVADIDNRERAELSNRLAPIGNAPLGIVLQLAKNEDVAVAGPVLERSTRLNDADLLEIARSASQGHLLAIAGRADIGEAVTEILADRGDPEVIRVLLDNKSARISEHGFARLVVRAAGDTDLRERIGLRPDLPPHLLRSLLVKAGQASEAHEALAATGEHPAGKPAEGAATGAEPLGAAATHDAESGERLVEMLRRQGKLREAELVEFARSGRHDETVAALASLCSLPIAVVNGLMAGERPDPLLILGKSAGWDWPIVRILLLAQHRGKAAARQVLDSAFTNFERLSPATAQRVMRFWQVRRAETR